MKNSKKSKMKNPETAAARHERGFSLVEALVAMAITLVILSAGLMVIKSMMDSKVSATSVSEVNNDNQAALNIIRRDLQKVDKFLILPSTGVPLPNIEWGANRCFNSPMNATNADCSSPNDNEMILLKATSKDNRGLDGLIGDYVFDTVTPGIVNGHDAVSLLYVDDSSRNISAGFSSSGTLESAASGDFKAIRAGDFVYLATNNIMQYVVSASASTITISDGPGLVTSSTSTVAETVHLLRRVTYYMESAPSEANPAWLMRQVNLRENPARVVPGITSFKLTYDILDRSTGASGVMEVNISPEVAGAWVAGDTYSTIKLEDVEDANFFIDHPYRVLNIVRVNVNVLTASDQAVQGNKRVKIDQTARIAVRGNPFTGSENPGPGEEEEEEEEDGDVFYVGCRYSSNGNKKQLNCNTPCINSNSVPSNDCKVYYYIAESGSDECESKGADNWIPVTSTGNPQANNFKDNNLDMGIATGIYNVPVSAYYCMLIEGFNPTNPGKTYISEKPFWMDK